MSDIMQEYHEADLPHIQSKDGSYVKHEAICKWLPDAVKKREIEAQIEMLGKLFKHAIPIEDKHNYNNCTQTSRHMIYTSQVQDLIDRLTAELKEKG